MTVKKQRQKTEVGDPIDAQQPNSVEEQRVPDAALRVRQQEARTTLAQFFSDNPFDRDELWSSD